jgi:uncharacterized protein
MVPSFTGLESFYLIALGIGVGTFGTLIGAGGGFVLMPIMLLMYPKISPDVLTAISLAVVFFNALSGSESYAMMRRIDYKSGLLFAAATIPGAIIGALNTGSVSRHVFDGIFSVMLLAGSIFLMLKPQKRKVLPKDEIIYCYPDFHVHLRDFKMECHMEEASGEEHRYAFNPFLGVGISFGVGYLSSFLGIGGGIIHVPMLIYLLNFPVHIATATSHFILAIMALTGTLVHVSNGTLTSGVQGQTLSLAIGVLLGAPLGAQLSSRIHGSLIVRGLASGLGLVGLRIFWLFLHGA